MLDYRVQSLCGGHYQLILLGMYMLNFRVLSRFGSHLHLIFLFGDVYVGL